MKQRFVILVDDATPAQQNAVTLFLKGKVGYWHHFSDAWLVASNSGEWTAAKLRDELTKVVSGPSVLVLKIDSPKGWAAFGTKGIFAWLHSTWSTD
jgi:hypothetical protein